MSRDWRLYWQDMHEAARRVVLYSAGMTPTSFHADNKTRDAVLRNLEVIGEAAKRIPLRVRQLAPAIDWRRISGFRDIVAHAYFGIDDAILWDIVSNKVTDLIKLMDATVLSSSDDPN